MKLDIFDPVREGNYDEFIKQYDGNVNSVDKYSKLNLLQMAVVNGEHPQEKIKIIEFLLKQGIDINYVDSKNKRNALHLFFFCVLRSDKEYFLRITKMLVEAGININALDKYNAIPLKYALTVNKLTTDEMKEVYAFLISKGSMYDQKDIFNKSCVDYSEEYSWRNDFKEILKEYTDEK